MLFGGLADWRVGGGWSHLQELSFHSHLRIIPEPCGLPSRAMTTTPVPSLAGMILERRGVYVGGELARAVHGPLTPLLSRMSIAEEGTACPPIVVSATHGKPRCFFAVWRTSDLAKGSMA